MNWTFTRILFQLYQLGCFRNLLNALTIFSDFTKRGGMSHIHSCHIMWWIITATELLLASGVSIKENQVILSYCKNLQHMNTHKLSPQTPFTSRFTGWPRWGSWKKLIRHPKDPKVWKLVTTLIGKASKNATWGVFCGHTHLSMASPAWPRTSFFWNILVILIHSWLLQKVLDFSAGSSPFRVFYAPASSERNKQPSWKVLRNFPSKIVSG